MATVVKAVADGKKETLIALRDTIARTIDECNSGRDMAALSKRLMEVMDEIEAIEQSEKEKDTPMSRRKGKGA